MAESTTFERICDIIRDNGGTADMELTPETKLADAGLDSLATVEAVMACEDEFGIEIEKNKIVQAEPIKTFGSFSVKAKLGYEVSGTINVLVVEG